MKPKYLIPLLLFSVLVTSCGKNAEKNTKLTIATAANMQFAMDSLVHAFSESTGVSCEIIISSSGKLTAQIKEGAPFDIFISADMKYPEELYGGGFTTAAPEVYAYGKLVLWSMKEDITPGMEILSTDRVRHIAIANPRTAPYGEAALEVLERWGLREKLENKLIYGESIAQTNQFITSKAAEAGFTAKSVVLSPQMRDQGKWLDLDTGLHTPIAQGVVILKKQEPAPAAAQLFYDYLFSAAARQILLDFGYALPDPILSKQPAR